MSLLELDDDLDYYDPELTGYQARLAPLRAAKGVVRLRFGASTGLVLLRYADVRNAFCDDVRFSKSKALRPITFQFMGPNLMGWDGAEHRLKRALVSRAFRRNTIPRYVAPLLRPIAEELVDDLAPLGEADLMAGFAKKYPLRITTRLLGIPRDDEDQMAGWAVKMLDMAGDAEGAARAHAAFTEY